MSVYKAINAVQADLSKIGISKDSRNTQGAGYNFRGIDAVYNTLSPLLAQHGLCILPRVLSRSCEERKSQADKALFYVTVEVEFDFVCADDGSKHTVKTFGEAMDSGDKATNKAMSAAYKYAALQAFAIPTEGDNDADSQTHEVSAKPAFAKTVSQATLEAMDEECQKFIAEVAQEVKTFLDANDGLGALEMIRSKTLDTDEKVALNAFFSSKDRSLMKKAKEQANGV